MRASLLAFFVLGCGASAAHPASPSLVTLPDAVAHAHALHPLAVAYAVDDLRDEPKPYYSVWMIEGGLVHGVHVEPGRGVTLDETFAVAEDAAPTTPILERELRARRRPLESGTAWMIDRYGARLRGVELELHGHTLVLEAILGAGDARAIHVHDPDDGRYLMTELGDAPR